MVVMAATIEPSDEDFSRKELVSIAELPIEKQFSIHSFEKEVDRMTLDQARYFLKTFRRQEELKLFVLKGVIKNDGL